MDVSTLKTESPIERIKERYSSEL